MGTERGGGAVEGVITPLKFIYILHKVDRTDDVGKKKKRKGKVKKKKTRRIV